MDFRRPKACDLPFLGFAALNLRTNPAPMTEGPQRRRFVPCRFSSDLRRLLQAAQSPDYRVAGRPGWTLSQQAEEFFSESPPVRKLVAKLPAPRCEHREDELPALVQQFLVEVRVVLADLFGSVGEVELDWSTAARLKVDEQRAVFRAEHIARPRLAMK